MRLKFHKGKGRIKRFMGVEIEISDYDYDYGSKIRDIVRKWGGECKDDGSIRPDNGYYDRTMEIATAPACGNLFRKQIKEICTVLKQAKAKANNSCGLHVHVDARDFTPNDVIKAELVWSKIEKQMFNRVAKERRGNYYCASRCKVNKHDFKGIQKSMEYLKAIDDDERYQALNFCALEYGTLENRMKEGTVNADEIIKWAELNAKIIDYIKKQPYEKVLNMGRLSVRRFE